MKIRHCMDCGAVITECNGYCKASDFLKALRKEIPFEAVREWCGKCILKPEHSPSLYSPRVEEHGQA